MVRKTSYLGSAVKNNGNKVLKSNEYLPGMETYRPQWDYQTTWYFSWQVDHEWNRAMLDKAYPETWFSPMLSTTSSNYMNILCSVYSPNKIYTKAMSKSLARTKDDRKRQSTYAYMSPGSSEFVDT